MYIYIYIYNVYIGLGYRRYLVVCMGIMKLIELSALIFEDNIIFIG